MIVGRAIADARVAARPVVERGDVIENDESRFLAGPVLVVVDELGLEGIEEALGHRVVQVGPDASPALPIAVGTLCGPEASSATPPVSDKELAIWRRAGTFGGAYALIIQYLYP